MYQDGRVPVDNCESDKIRRLILNKTLLVQRRKKASGVTKGASSRAKGAEEMQIPLHPPLRVLNVVYSGRKN